MDASELKMIPCSECCKEVPLDAAFTPEGAEYVEYFCGLECYQYFLTRARTRDKEELGRLEKAPDDHTK